MSFHGAEVAWYVFWQERNSSRSSGVAIPVALKKSSYWRIRWARDLSDSPLGAMQSQHLEALRGLLHDGVDHFGGVTQVLLEG